MDLVCADLHAKRCYRTQLLGYILDRTLGLDMEDILIANCRPDGHRPPPQPHAPAIDNLARVLEGHWGEVKACDWSPEGSRLVSAGLEGTLRLWDATTGKPLTIIHTLPGREYAVLESDGSGFRSASPGAWRQLGWQVKDPETGRL